MSRKDQFLKMLEKEIEFPVSSKERAVNIFNLTKLFYPNFSQETKEDELKNS